MTAKTNGIILLAIIAISMTALSLTGCGDGSGSGGAPSGPTTETVATPTATPQGGTFTTAQSVTLATPTAGASIYYTVDDTAPTTNSTLYSSAIPLSATTTLKAIAVKNGMNNSGIMTEQYTINIPANTVVQPEASLLAGTYPTAQSVTLSTTTTGATIHYTTDGSDPATSSTVYSSPIAINTTTTLKAIAVKNGMTNSSVLTAVYTINTTGSSDIHTNDFATQFSLLGLASGTNVITDMDTRFTTAQDLNGGSFRFYPITKDNSTDPPGRLNGTVNSVTLGYDPINEGGVGMGFVINNNDLFIAGFVSVKLTASCVE